MKAYLLLISILILSLLVACQTNITPEIEALTTMQSTEFTLAPGQSTQVSDTALTITFDSVLSDARCPSEVDCAESGPVAVLLTVQERGEQSSQVTLTAFTAYDGRAVDSHFEGIEDRFTYRGYLIRVIAVLPYPRYPEVPILAADYRLTLIVTQTE